MTPRSILNDFFSNGERGCGQDSGEILLLAREGPHWRVHFFFFDDDIFKGRDKWQGGGIA